MTSHGNHLNARVNKMVNDVTGNQLYVDGIFIKVHHMEYFHNLLVWPIDKGAILSFPQHFNFRSIIIFGRVRSFRYCTVTILFGTKYFTCGEMVVCFFF